MTTDASVWIVIAAVAVGVFIVREVYQRARRRNQAMRDIRRLFDPRSKG